MVLYHATEFSNLEGIFSEGIKTSPEGVVYLAETPEDALKFVFFRGWKSILVVKVDVDPDKVVETFDHSLEFFRCKAYGHVGLIPSTQVVLEGCMRYSNLSSNIRQ